MKGWLRQKQLNNFQREVRTSRVCLIIRKAGISWACRHALAGHRHHAHLYNLLGKMDISHSILQQEAELQSFLHITVCAFSSEHKACAMSLSTEEWGWGTDDEDLFPQEHMWSHGRCPRASWSLWLHHQEWGVPRERVSAGERRGVCAEVDGREEGAAGTPQAPREGLCCGVSFLNSEKAVRWLEQRPLGDKPYEERKKKKSRPWMEPNKQRILRRSKIQRAGREEDR